MKSITAIAVVIAVSVGPANAYMPFDPPWNPAHVNGLPPEVRTAVLAMCESPPSAQHYFALYTSDQVTLHFELFQCGRPLISFCREKECLHQVYKLTQGHYRLVKSAFGPKDD